MVGKNNATMETKNANKEVKDMKETKKVIKGAKSVKASKEVKGEKKVEKKPAKVEKEIKKEEVKVEETKKVEKKDNAKKRNAAVPQLKNSELAKLFADNGCLTKTKAKDSSNVVYNTFGTESRVLQQKNAYQLLLTNGHDRQKGIVIEAESDDVARFTEWYNGLSDEQKQYVNGFDTITATKLATSELPRERTVKVTNLDLLVDFIKFMSTFTENQMASATK